MSLFILLLLFAAPLPAHEETAGSPFVFLDPIIWTVREGGADNWAQVITPKGARQSATLTDAPFDWDAGFRAGIGYENPGGWDAVIYYTGFQTQSANQASGQVYSAFLGNFYANNPSGANFGPTYQSADIRWEFSFNTADLELGRTFQIDEILKLRPFVGLKAAVIDQNIHSNWRNPTVPTNFTSAVEDLKDDFWGFGPSLGLDETWSLCAAAKSSFSITGDISGALLWGHWSFSDLYQNDAPSSVSIDLRHIDGAAPMARAFMGLEWAGRVWGADTDVRLGYEAQVWFGQMQFYSYNMGRLDNLMSLRGGVLDLKLHF